MATPASIARGNDTMPAITAAASARTSVFGPSVSRSLRGAAVVGRHQDHRERGHEPGDRPDRGGDDLRVDALHAGEVGVLGRRLDRAADQRAVEEPAERERHDRHDDEHRELRAGDPHPERRRSTSLSIAGGYDAPKSVISGYAVTIASARPEIPIVATSTIDARRVEQPPDRRPAP